MIPNNWQISMWKEKNSSAWVGYVSKKEGRREITINSFEFSPSGFDSPQDLMDALEKEILK